MRKRKCSAAYVTAVLFSSSASLTLISLFFVCTGMITQKGDSDVVGAAITTNERNRMMTRCTGNAMSMRDEAQLFTCVMKPTAAQDRGPREGGIGTGAKDRGSTEA